MKNILKTSFLGALVIVTASAILPINSSAQTQTETRAEVRTETRMDSRLLPINVRIDEKAKLEIEAALKKENAFCETYSSAERKAACVKENNSRAELRLQQIMKGQTSTSPKTVLPMPPKNNDVSNDMVYPPGVRPEDRKDGMKNDRMKDDRSGPGNNGQGFENRMHGRMNLRALFTGHIDLVLKSQDAIYERFLAIADRIDSRIEKLRAESVDVSVAAKFVAEARTELKLAKNAIDSAKSAYETELAANKSNNSLDEEKSDETSLKTEFRQKIISKKTDFPKTFAYIEEIKKHLLLVHRNLGQAVMNLKVDIKN